MKKIFLISLISLFTCNLFAQSGFGVKGGLNFNSMSDVAIKDVETSVNNRTGYHIGVMYKLKLPLGLALQPELLFVHKSNSIKDEFSSMKYTTKQNYLQLPVNLQWGVDLVLFRPFIMVTPYLSYAISTNTKIENFSYSKFQYGIGCGVGLEIWKIQVTGKYLWSGKSFGHGDLNQSILENKINFGKNRGFELSLGILF